MRTIAITNQKGGSGKTTTAVNLAAALGEKKQRVLVIDLDAQSSASAWLGVPDGGKGLYDAFVNNGNLSDIIHKTEVPGVSLVPSSAWLLNAERELSSETGAETILRIRLKKLRGEWDFVLLDCPPVLNLLTSNALTAAGEILIPVEATVLALGGLAQLLRTVEKIKERLNPNLEVSGIIPFRVDYRTRHAQEVEELLRERFGKLVYKTVIRENTRLKECPSFRQPITQYDPQSHGAEDFHNLAAETLKRNQGGKA